LEPLGSNINLFPDGEYLEGDLRLVIKEVDDLGWLLSDSARDNNPTFLKEMFFLR